MKDLTKIKTPFGLLGKKTRKALRAHFEAGGEIKIYLEDGGWTDCLNPFNSGELAYRAKPPSYGKWFDAHAELAKIEAAKPHPIFAAVKEWQEARAEWVHGKIPPTSWDAACVALYAIVVPS